MLSRVCALGWSSVAVGSRVCWEREWRWGFSEGWGWGLQDGRPLLSWRLFVSCVILLHVSSVSSYSLPVISMSAVSTLRDNMLGISTTHLPELCPDHISAISTASTTQQHGCPCLHTPTALWEVTCAPGAPLWASICGCRAVVGEQQEAI